MYVIVNLARWNKNAKVYDLLIDAVAGAADRAAWPNESCYSFPPAENPNAKEKYIFCNTVDHIAVTFPRGHSMDVTLSSSSPPGRRGDTFDCDHTFRTKAERYVEDLQAKIAEQVGDEDLYTMTTCEHWAR